MSITTADHRRVRAVSALLATVLVGSASVTATASAAGMPADLDHVLVQAHRGGPDLGTAENSLAAFRAAIDSGVVDRIELDVRPSKDGTPMVVHDEKLPSVCTKPGKRVRELTTAQLRATSCSGEPIPTLDEALALIRGLSGTVVVNIELKMWSPATSSEKKTFANAVAASAKRSGLPDRRLVFSSYFWRSYAAPLKKARPGVFFSGMEKAGGVTMNKGKPYSTILRAHKAGVDGFSIPVAQLTDGMLSLLADLGVRPGFGDRKDSDDVRFALARGLNVWTHDDPHAARRQIDTWAARLQAEPLARKDTTTTLPAPTYVLKNKSRSVAAKKKYHTQVLGGTTTIATKQQEQLVHVNLRVTVQAKKAGKLTVVPTGGRSKDAKTYSYPAGRTTLTVRGVPGDQGKATMTASTALTKATIQATGWTTVSY